MINFYSKFPLPLMITLMLFGLMGQVQAQENEQSIDIQVTFQNQPIVLGQSYYSRTLQDTILFQKIKFYLTDLQFLDAQGTLQNNFQKHYLIDLEQPNSQQIVFERSEELPTMLAFKVGVDSLTNVTGAHGGALDPTKGMYWAWQSGYINFKLEGSTPKCPGRNHTFQYHIGGYQAPFQTIQSVELAIDDPKTIQLEVAIDRFLEQMDVTQAYEIMSPGKKAAQAAEQLTQIFDLTK